MTRYSLPLVALVALFAGGTARADEKLDGIACRSVHLQFPAGEGVAFYNEVTVEKSAPGTYFCAIGWNKGYFGIQESGAGKKVVIFSVWDSNQNDPKKVDEIRVGRLVLDGDVILPADGATVTERRRISVNGVITVALPVGEDGRLAGTPHVRPFGVPVEEDRDDFIADAVDSATRAFDPNTDEEKMREAVRLAVRRCATAWTGKKPIVEVMVVRVAIA